MFQTTNQLSLSFPQSLLSTSESLPHLPFPLPWHWEMMTGQAPLKTHWYSPMCGPMSHLHQLQHAMPHLFSENTFPMIHWWSAMNSWFLLVKPVKPFLLTMFGQKRKHLAPWGVWLLPRTWTETPVIYETHFADGPNEIGPRMEPGWSHKKRVIPSIYIHLCTYIICKDM